MSLGRFPDALAKYQIAQTLAPEDSEISGHISEVEAQIAQGPVSKPGPAPLADYDDPTAIDFEEGENEPTFVETEPYPSPVPPQPPPVAPGPGSQEAVFEFEGTETTVSGASEPPAIPPAQPAPKAPSVPTEPTEVVYEFEGRDREPAVPATPIQPVQSPVEAPGKPGEPGEPGEVVYELEGSEVIEPETPPDVPPPSAHTPSPGEVVYDLEDKQEALSGKPVSAPGPPSDLPAAEPIFELEGSESPLRPEREPSTAARRQAEEIRTTPAVSDEARAMQEEFEQSFPTGVVQRQVREIKDSARVPKPRTHESSPETTAEPVLPSRPRAVV